MRYYQLQVFQLPRLSHLIAFYLGALLILAIAPLSSVQVNAQTVNKITVAKRSGDIGYVVRIHMNKAPKGFELAQPYSNALEIKLADPKLSLGKLNTGLVEHPIVSVKKVDFKGGGGLVLELKPGEYYTSKVYLDSNKRDVLIALTRASEEQALDFFRREKGFGWAKAPAITAPIAVSTNTSKPSGSTPQVPTNGRTRELSEDEATAITTADETYRRVRDNVKFDVVVIDAGHGGHDAGAIGFAKSKEKDLALKTALKLGALIEKNMPDVKVVYTRSDDRFISLAERGRIANRAQGDLFISIHGNAARNRAAYGAEVFFMGTSKTDDALDVMLRENSVVTLEERTPDIVQMSPEQLLAYELANAGNMASSEKVASYIIDEFIGHAKRHSRGVKQAPFWVLYHASMPAVLVELGFISNKEEEAYLITDKAQTELAEAMYFAVKRYREQYERGLNMFAEPSPAKTPVQRVNNEEQ
jgi:N-acetylmuramoyl-L-alanine amidase